MIINIHHPLLKVAKHGVVKDEKLALCIFEMLLNLGASNDIRLELCGERYVVFKKIRYRNAIIDETDGWGEGVQMYELMDYIKILCRYARSKQSEADRLRGALRRVIDSVDQMKDKL